MQTTIRSRLIQIIRHCFRVAWHRRIVFRSINYRAFRTTWQSIGNSHSDWITYSEIFWLFLPAGISLVRNIGREHFFTLPFSFPLFTPRCRSPIKCSPAMCWMASKMYSLKDWLWCGITRHYERRALHENLTFFTRISFQDSYCFYNYFIRIF